MCDIASDKMMHGVICDKIIGDVSCNKAYVTNWDKIMRAILRPKRTTREVTLGVTRKCITCM